MIKEFLNIIKTLIVGFIVLMVITFIDCVINWEVFVITFSVGILSLIIGYLVLDLWDDINLKK
ncbi:MAG: hypothetical protein ACLR4X_04875 [Clostridia bacterium]